MQTIKLPALSDRELQQIRQLNQQIQVNLKDLAEAAAKWVEEIGQAMRAVTPNKELTQFVARTNQLPKTKKTQPYYLQYEKKKNCRKNY